MTDLAPLNDALPIAPPPAPAAQLPTVGRIVLFRPPLPLPGSRHADPVPAVITRVWGPEIVNLKVLADGFLDHWLTSVPMGDAAGTWCWPPRA